jgi:hypothetical protein
MKKKYPRRAVVREDFNSRGMSCNYWQQNKQGEKWHLHYADGTIVPDGFTTSTKFGEKYIAEHIWIELIEGEKISYLGKLAF